MATGLRVLPGAGGNEHLRPSHLGRLDHPSRIDACAKALFYPGLIFGESFLLLGRLKHTYTADHWVLRRHLVPDGLK